MDPVVGRIIFTVGVFLIVLALIPLPFLSPRTVEFWVDLAGLFMSLIVVLAVGHLARRSRASSRPTDSFTWQEGEEEEI